MRVGVYIDGLNLYYGGRGLVGRDVQGWRWLDIRSLVESFVTPRWPDAHLSRIVYCTADVLANGVAGTMGARERQTDYLRALKRHKSVDLIEKGRFQVDIKIRPLGIKTPDGAHGYVYSRPPLLVKDADWGDVRDALLLGSFRDNEEKGTDVNVASHLLIDVLEGKVDAAILVSNDSDLGFAVSHARSRAPVGVINPTKRPTATVLKARYPGPDQWWDSLEADDFLKHQLTDPCQGISKPLSW